MGQIPLISKYTTTSFVDSNCKPNTSYQYSIIPYNVTNDAGETVQLSSVTTLPYLISVTPGRETSSSIQINFQGIYSYVRVYRNGNDITNGRKIYDTSFVDTSSISSNNIPYTYTVIPYNIGDVSGLEQSIKIYSFASISVSSVIPVTVTTNSAAFTFDGSYVRANLEIHITKAELQQVKSDLENELRMLQTNPNVKVSDEEIKSYNDEIGRAHV